MKLIRPGLLLGLSLALLPFSSEAQAQAGRRDTNAKPKPDLAEVKYGPHERNVLDLWKAPSDKPTPVVVFIHGGGFRGGSKEQLAPALLDALLKNGISVMAINYRLSPEVHFPAHYLDCARAIQFARQHAKDWHLDPKRVGATGGSAGAGTSLWLGFHADLADKKNDDPVLRESTRLSCIAVQGAQSTYDPRVIKEWVGEPASKHPALQGFYGLTDDELDSPKAHKLYAEASPINFLTADDPPVFLFYNEADRPLPENATPGAGIHHPNFGRKLKVQMDKLKIECVMKHMDDYRGGGGNPEEDMVKFFVKYLGTPISQTTAEPPFRSMGRLGYTLGTRLTIEGMRARKGKVGVRTLMVDTINGEKLARPMDIWVDNLVLPETERCVLEGYETGKEIGMPPAERKLLEKKGQRGPQAAWQFGRYFVATSVAKPESLKINP